MLHLFNKYVEDYPIRSLSLSLGNLIQIEYYQPSLLENIEEQEKKRKLMRTLDNIKTKYGANAIFRGNQLLEASNALERHQKIGGHAR